jgi:Holliday junction resolvasome RuvABC DNA-binding subunit
MAGPGDVHDVEVELFDDPIEMREHERLPGIGTKVAEQAVLDVLDGLSGLASSGLSRK